MTRKKIEIPPFNIADYSGWRTDEGLAHWLNNKVVPSIEQYLSPREITDEEIENESFQFQGDSGDCAFQEGARWALAKMKERKE